MPSSFESGRSPLHPHGVRPGQHEPGLLWAWVFDQHQVWVDIHGTEHEIDSMPLDYIRNVISFCELRAADIRAITQRDRLEHALNLFVTGAIGEAADLYTETMEAHTLDVSAWLEHTPLMRALRRRINPPDSQANPRQT